MFILITLFKQYAVAHCELLAVCSAAGKGGKTAAPRAVPEKGTDHEPASQNQLRLAPQEQISEENKARPAGNRWQSKGWWNPCFVLRLKYLDPFVGEWHPYENTQHQTHDVVSRPSM